jgi:hypothetical protein
MLEPPLDEKVPALHAVHCDAPGPEKYPGIHCLQRLLPTTGLKVPAGHLVQAVDPEPLAKLPTGHERQADRPAAVPNMPTMQFWHDVCPAVGLKVETGQSLHGKPTPGAKVPTGQMAQLVLPTAVLLKPDSHA